MDGEPIALKRLRPLAPDLDPQAAELAERARRRALFEEYRNQLAVGRLRGFPRLYGYASVEGQPAILMEWVEGITLRDAIPLLPREEGGCTGRAVADVGVAVLEVLAGVARLDGRLVHRDLSPRNVMLRTRSRTVAEQFAHGRPEVVLVDFGSSTIPEPDEPSLTTAADIWRNGTPEYAPPEMLTRDVASVTALRSSPKIDVYALCSVLYELYGGRTPFMLAQRRGESPYRVKTECALSELEPRSPGDVELCEAIMSGIRGFQDARPSPEELLRRLRAWRG